MNLRILKNSFGEQRLQFFSSALVSSDSSIPPPEWVDVPIIDERRLLFDSGRDIDLKPMPDGGEPWNLTYQRIDGKWVMYNSMGGRWVLCEVPNLDLDNFTVRERPKPCSPIDG